MGVRSTKAAFRLTIQAEIIASKLCCVAVAMCGVMITFPMLRNALSAGRGSGWVTSNAALLISPDFSAPISASSSTIRPIINHYQLLARITICCSIPAWHGHVSTTTKQLGILTNLWLYSQVWQRVSSA